MPFKKGQSGNPSGRSKGAPNKVTASVKESFLEVFTELQSHPTANLKAWAQMNQTEFYKLAGKMIPTQLQGELSGKDGAPLFPTVGVVVQAMKAEK